MEMSKKIRNAEKNSIFLKAENVKMCKKLKYIYIYIYMLFSYFCRLRRLVFESRRVTVSVTEDRLRRTNGNPCV